MLEKIIKCPLCSCTSQQTFIESKDYFLSGESFSIQQCEQCSFKFTNPRPTFDEIGKYYESKEYISHTGKANNLLNFIYKIAQQYTLTKKEKIVNKYCGRKSILDFGCGTGDFLHTCNQKGWKIHGFEPDKNARNIASSKNGIPIFSSIEQISHLPPIDIITLWHVLEHIHDLNQTIKILSSKLTEDGKILIGVPNHECYDAKFYKEFWAAYDLPRHLYHFSQSTMKLLLKKHALKINAIIPMKLDSFYVSLLSEKYKNGKQNYITSFINGYKSNTYAKKNHYNYSSLIYIASK